MSEKPRVVVALPDMTEGAAVADWLAAEGYDPVRCWTTRAAQDEMIAHPFDLLIADSVFAFRDGLHTKGRSRNPLTPSIVVGDTDAAPLTETINSQTMCLTRPLERAMLICYVSMAMLDGRPARRSARKVVNRVDAFVNGLPTRLIDVSNEGVRLEVAAGRRHTLPPYFNIRVPHMGVAVTVQRVWTRPSPSRASMTWYGGTLSQNRTLAEQAWRSFVDTVPVIGETTSIAASF
jgi:hypothetical protein